MALKPSTNTQRDYISRINKTIDYIDSHIHQALTLEELAEVASFSKFHFHRIFFAFTAETPFQFIQRIRLEKAAMLLVANKFDSITDVAIKCGFSELAIFSRNFKQYFKVSASEYRNACMHNSNISQINSNNSKTSTVASMYICESTNQIKWRTTMKLNKGVEIKNLPPMTLAYLRHIGPYKGDEKLFEGLWNRLFAWAGPRNLIGGPDFKSLIIYHDDLHVTDEDKLRMSICISVPSETKVEGEIGKMELEGGNYALAHFEISGEQFQEAWEWVYSQWLPNSGYEPDDKPCFEMYTDEPKDGKFMVDICIPVKPA